MPPALDNQLPNGSSDSAADHKSIWPSIIQQVGEQNLQDVASKADELKWRKSAFDDSKAGEQKCHDKASRADELKWRSTQFGDIKAAEHCLKPLPMKTEEGEQVMVRGHNVLIKEDGSVNIAPRGAEYTTATENGITTITLGNGDKVSFDKQGIRSVQHGNEVTEYSRSHQGLEPLPKMINDHGHTTKFLDIEKAEYRKLDK